MVSDPSDPFADVSGPSDKIVHLREHMDARGEHPLIFRPSTFVWRDPATIPRREFIYGYELRRKQVSGKISPGATGKTTHEIGRAVSIATGMERFGHRVWNGPHRVWIWNLEDEREEVEKTVHAFLKLWDIPASALGDRLMIDGRDSPLTSKLKLAVDDGRRGFVVQRPVAEALIAALVDNKVDVLSIDPFVSSHGVDENDNSAVDAVVKEWLRVADEANCAISLTHHIRKPNGTTTSAHDARGASAMVNAARSVLVLQRMTADQADDMKIEACDMRGFFSVYDDKNNKAPAAAHAEWYKFEGVGMGNGDDRGPEDNMGALNRWYPPDTFAGVSSRQLLHIQQMMQSRPDACRKHSMSPLWAGKLVALVLDRNLDDEKDRKAIKKMLSVWLSNGALRTVERRDDKREVKEYLEVGKWAIVE